ncbi:hypothetical protein E3N88_08134 [Mikania micrantha]|uniref:RING-type E3 ubiquitin transferase n=1 Tax=Mikania micrantha TaxID=192012 RepID=A0A5N6PFC8_9ASTR|nr:hypothetical protein E3N88_08134 [Mikania micrantha]
MIIFQNYGELGVKSIIHDPKKLTLNDPKDCVFEVFLNLNLDSTPFRYYHVVKNYTYLNCSISLSGSLEPVPCLSGSKHHVYVVESSLDVPSSCEVVKTVSIPFAYSSYVSDDSFGLDLTWDSTGFVDFAEEKRGIEVQTVVEGLIMVVLVILIVGFGCLKVYCWKKSRSIDHEWENLLGVYESFYEDFNFGIYPKLKPLKGQDRYALGDQIGHVVKQNQTLYVPISCEVVKTVSIPFAYNSYVSDDGFGLDLTWDSAGFVDFVEEKRGIEVETVVEGLIMVVLVILIVGFGCLKVYF